MPAHAAYIDEVEVGTRVAGHIRVAFQVDDAAEATRRLRGRRRRDRRRADENAVGLAQRSSRGARRAPADAVRGACRRGARAHRCVGHPRTPSDSFQAIDDTSTCWSSAPAAPACARRSRPTMRGPASRSSQSSTRHGAVPAPPRAVNAALGNKADDNPETHAFDTVKGPDYLGDRTRSRSSRVKRRATSTSSRTGAASSRGSRGQARPAALRGRGLPRPSTRPTSPGTSSSRCSTSSSRSGWTKAWSSSRSTSRFASSRRVVAVRGSCAGISSTAASSSSPARPRSSRRAAWAVSIGRPRMHTPAPGTAWRSRSMPGSRSRTWSSCSSTRRRCTRPGSSSPRAAEERAAT